MNLIFRLIKIVYVITDLFNVSANTFCQYSLVVLNKQASLSRWISKVLAHNCCVFFKSYLCGAQCSRCMFGVFSHF